MTKIKICGITHSTEIEYLNKYLPDYAGFVFAKSKRRVTADKAVILSAYLTRDIKKVGVFVDMEPASAAIIAAQVGLDVIQLHGSEDDKYIRTLRSMLKHGAEIWKAVRVSAGFMDYGSPVAANIGTYTTAPDFSSTAGLIPSAGVDRLLLDSYVPDCPGGSGKPFDWTLASRFGSALPIVLAGGLTADNVKQAIDLVRPFAVDVSSGVESEGVKDEYMLKAFIEAVRRQ